MSPAVQTASTVPPILAFRGYAHCPFWKIFLLSHPDGPIIVFCLSLLIGTLIPMLLYRRRKKIEMNAGIISIGNMSLCTLDSCFYDEQHNCIRLTPLQYSLMKMFFLSSSHYLCKAEICQSLWPGKDNADETLYTLIRRLKPIVEANSNLYIKTDRSGGPPRHQGAGRTGWPPAAAVCQSRLGRISGDGGAHPVSAGIDHAPLPAARGSGQRHRPPQRATMHLLLGRPGIVASLREWTNR